MRELRPALNGKYLQQSLGMPPGPEMGRTLDALRDALLDGEIKTREEQEAFVRERLGVERAVQSVLRSLCSVVEKAVLAEGREG